MFGQQGNQSHNNDQYQQPAPAVPPITNDGPAGAPSWQHPGLPLAPPAGSDSAAPLTVAPLAPAAPTPLSTPVASNPTPDATEDLIDIKQHALSQLTPLVDKLDQSPEEHFRTTMMLIQASDNQALVKDAYAAAQNIADEKVRAQALLDIVNEINYFTQQQEA